MFFLQRLDLGLQLFLFHHVLYIMVTYNIKHTLVHYNLYMYIHGMGFIYAQKMEI